MSDDIVALLLQDDMPAARLGALLRAARKRRGWKRKHAAAKAGTTAEKLRAYERARLPIPPEVCARLAECYGDALRAHVPVRTPMHVDDDWLVVGQYELPLTPASADEILGGYVKIVRRLRHVKKGDPLPLRTADVHILAAALMQDRDDVERRLADLLGCSREEARALHGELLRRKVVLPVAGLAAGIATLAGAAHAAAESQAPAVPPAPHEAVAPPSNTPDTDAAPVVHLVAVPTTEAPTPTTEAPHESAPVPTPTTAVATVRTMQVVPVTPPSVAPAPAQHETDATVPAEERPADAPMPGIAVPQADPHDVSILPGEHPYKIIGEPSSEHS